jgi:hypothetical protein
MPDDNGIGKRLYLTRLAAAGLVGDARPPQSAYDAAADLVRRVLALHVRDMVAVYRSLLVGYALMGLTLGLMAGVAWGMAS